MEKSEKATKLLATKELRDKSLRGGYISPEAI